LRFRDPLLAPARVFNISRAFFAEKNEANLFECLTFDAFFRILFLIP